MRMVTSPSRQKREALVLVTNSCTSTKIQLLANGIDLKSRYHTQVVNRERTDVDDVLHRQILRSLHCGRNPPPINVRMPKSLGQSITVGAYVICIVLCCLGLQSFCVRTWQENRNNALVDHMGRSHMMLWCQINPKYWTCKSKYNT